jgi:hypothetical protein
LARGEAGVVDAAQPPVARIGQVAPGGGERAAGERPAGKLPGLAEIGERERAEIVGMRDQAADGVVGKGLGALAGDGARSEPAQLVVGIGDGAVRERPALLLQLQGAIVSSRASLSACQ